MVVKMYGEIRNQLLEDAYRFDSPDVDAETLIITLNETNLNCGNIADKLFEKINIYKDDYQIFIIDFTNVQQVSEIFFYKYIKYLLASRFKIFNFNMSLLVESAWTVCLENFFTMYEEED